MTISRNRYVALVHFRTLVRMGQRFFCLARPAAANDNGAA